MWLPLKIFGDRELSSDALLYLWCTWLWVTLCSASRTIYLARAPTRGRQPGDVPTGP